jgi:methionyl-tRNA formyltransferase
MGSPDFALPTLRALDEHFEVVGVVTQPDRPAGRGREMRPPDVKVLAETLSLPVIQPKTLKSPETLAQLEAWAPDVIVVAAFGQILRENVLTLPPFGCVNVHASLLPRWRGASPVQAAVLHDDVTGVTIMKMGKGLDTGPILSQRVVEIPDDQTAGELFYELAEMGAALLVETLPGYLAGEIVPQLQDDALATYAPKISKSDGELDLTQPAEALARKVRAYSPWPGTFHSFEGQNLKVHRATALPEKNATPGRRLVVDDQPAWGTGEGLLVLEEVQLAGKSRVSGEAFLRGAKNWLPE